MTPLQKYQQDLQLPDFQADATQANAINLLDDLYHQLTSNHDTNLFTFWRKTVVKGIYLWGNVGAGKTYLLDTFYNCLPLENKLREHFHVFMRNMHEKLKKLQGKSDPLKELAKQISENTQIICFDEFVVNDIADAMLLGRLFEVLFAQGITLVATSNLRLDDLYHDGLQRDRFLPAITLLKAHLQEIEIGNDIDYRMQSSPLANVYFYPLTKKTEQSMQDSYLHYAQQQTDTTIPLEINHRLFQTIKYCAGVVWFKFDELCDMPTNPADYLAIAAQFHTVLISDVKKLNDERINIVIRFINLIDVLYDEQVRLIISADQPLDNLYVGKQAAFEFERTISRLTEMHSMQYLGSVLNKKAP